MQNLWCGVKAQRIALICAMVGLGLSGCSPAWDWRQMAWPEAGLRWSAPCRPQEMQRSQTVAGQALVLTQRACEHRGHTWSLACAPLVDPDGAVHVLQHWRSAVLAGVKTSEPVQHQERVPRNALALPGSGRWQVQGMWQGEKVALDGLWFVHPVAGALQACHAVHLATTPAGELSQPFWEGIQLRP